VKLSALLEPIQDKKTVRPKEKMPVIDIDPEVSSIHYRSQTVRPGGVFVAIPGQTADGHDFIDDAMSRGAVAIVAQHPINKHTVVIEVNNTRKALAAISSRFYAYPSMGLCIVGVTGTNGKTTTTYIIENIFARAGFNVGVIGTINYRYSGETFDNPMTTPESLDLQRILSEMAEHGVTHVVMEVSSHAIDLCRVDDCWFDVGVFTNFSQDHLDFHNDMDTYWSCKQRLFTEILASGPKREHAVAVINCDDDKGNTLFHSYPLKKISVGSSKDVTIGSRRFKSDLNGISGVISIFHKDMAFNSSLVGGYNIENILCAVGTGVALTLSPNIIRAGIADTTCIPGRLEFIPNDSGKLVCIDYAHTPGALENVLRALWALKTKKIICVFGCGGDRDKLKRSQMGEIAGRLCDLSVITTDNPRTEAPMEIIRQIEKGAQKASSHFYTLSELEAGLNQVGYIIEPDREKAVQLGIRVAGSEDIVLIAGKGHETYQIIKDKTIPFDDKKVAENALCNNPEAGLS